MQPTAAPNMLHLAEMQGNFSQQTILSTLGLISTYLAKYFDTSQL